MRVAVALHHNVRVRYARRLSALDPGMESRHIGLLDVRGSIRDIGAPRHEAEERGFGLLVLEAVCGFRRACRDIEIETSALYNGNVAVVDSCADGAAGFRLGLDLELLVAGGEVPSAVRVHVGEGERSDG